MNHGRQEKLFAISSLFKQTVPPLKKKAETKVRLTNPCSPPARWPPPPSCGCNDGIKCSAVSQWTQLNVAAVMSSRRFPFSRFRKGVRGSTFKGFSAVLSACSSASVANIRLNVLYFFIFLFFLELSCAKFRTSSPSASQLTFSVSKKQWLMCTSLWIMTLFCYRHYFVVI